MNLQELRSVQDAERRKSDLQDLRESFYEEAGRFVADLKAERQRAAENADDPFSDPEVKRLSDEIGTAEEVVEAIYERRMGKILDRASLAAADMAADEEGLTAEEKDLFHDLVARIETNKSTVLDTVAGDPGSPTAGRGTGDGGAAGAEGDPDRADRADRTGETDEAMSAAGAMGGPDPSGDVDDDPDRPADGGGTDGDRRPDPEADARPPEADASSAAADASTDPDLDPTPGAGRDPTPDVDPTPGDGRDPTTAAGAGSGVDRVEPGSPPPDGGRPGGAGPPDSGGEGTPGGAAASGGDRPTDGTAGSGAAMAAAEERVTVRITEDVGPIYGVDDREYDLERGTVAELPATNADPLLDRGAAERLD